MSNITTHSLALKVQAVRNAQRMYFQQIGEARRKQVAALFTQANATKEISKKLENELDQLVENVLLADPSEPNRLEQIHLLIHQIQHRLNATFSEGGPATLPVIMGLLQQAHSIAAGKEVKHG